MIGDVLGISPHTVDTHLRRIYAKLGVSDRISAALAGVGIGLIHSMGEPRRHATSGDESGGPEARRPLFRPGMSSGGFGPQAASASDR